MGDVFKRTNVRYGGTFAPDKGMLVPNKGLTGVLMQNLQVRHSRQKTTIFDIGTSGVTRAVYYVGGPVQGNINIGHILGPDIAVSQFYNSFSDICGVDDNTLTLKLDKQACGKNSNATSQNTYMAKFCIMTDIGFDVDGQSLMIREQSTLDFTGLEIEERTDGTLGGLIGGAGAAALGASAGAGALANQGLIGGTAAQIGETELDANGDSNLGDAFGGVLGGLDAGFPFAVGNGLDDSGLADIRAFA